jgi:hypothetical protein
VGFCEFASGDYFGLFGSDDAGAAAGECGGCWSGGVLVEVNEVREEGRGMWHFFDLAPRPPPDFFITPWAIVVVVGGGELSRLRNFWWRDFVDPGFELLCLKSAISISQSQSSEYLAKSIMLKSLGFFD